MSYIRRRNERDKKDKKAKKKKGQRHAAVEKAFGVSIVDSLALALSHGPMIRLFFEICIYIVSARATQQPIHIGHPERSPPPKS